MVCYELISNGSYESTRGYSLTEPVRTELFRVNPVSLPDILTPPYADVVLNSSGFNDITSNIRAVRVQYEFEEERKKLITLQDEFKGGQQRLDDELAAAGSRSRQLEQRERNQRREMERIQIQLTGLTGRQQRIAEQEQQNTALSLELTQQRSEVRTMISEAQQREQRLRNDLRDIQRQRASLDQEWSRLRSQDQETQRKADAVARGESDLNRERRAFEQLKQQERDAAQRMIDQLQSSHKKLGTAEVLKWRGDEYEAVKEHVQAARKALRNDNLGRVQVHTERGNAALQDVRRKTTDDLTKDTERKYVSEKILNIILPRLGYGNIRTARKNKSDLRSDALIVGVRPAGQILQMRISHEGKYTIGFRGVDGDSEAHSFGDAIEELLAQEGVNYQVLKRAAPKPQRREKPAIEQRVTKRQSERNAT